MTDFRKVTSIDFAIKHNGIYSVSVNSKLPEHIEAILGKRAKYTLYSNII